MEAQVMLSTDLENLFIKIAKRNGYRQDGFDSNYFKGKNQIKVKSNYISADSETSSFKIWYEDLDFNTEAIINLLRQLKFIN